MAVSNDPVQVPVTWVDEVVNGTVIAYVVVAAAKIGARVMLELVKVSAESAETVAAAVLVMVTVYVVLVPFSAKPLMVITFAAPAVSGIAVARIVPLVRA